MISVARAICEEREDDSYAIAKSACHDLHFKCKAHVVHPPAPLAHPPALPATPAMPAMSAVMQG